MEGCRLENGITGHGRGMVWQMVSHGKMGSHAHSTLMGNRSPSISRRPEDGGRKTTGSRLSGAGTIPADATNPMTSLEEVACPVLF